LFNTINVNIVDITGFIKDTKFYNWA